jgi:hypothetical protein
VPGHFNGLPGIEVAENLFLQVSAFLAKVLQFVLGLLAKRCRFQFHNPIFEFVNRFFKR